MEAGLYFTIIGPTVFLYGTAPALYQWRLFEVNTWETEFPGSRTEIIPVKDSHTSLNRWLWPVATAVS